VAETDPLQDAVFEPVLRPERLRRTISPRQIEERGGLPADEIVDSIRGFGLSIESPDDPWFTEEEAQVYVELAHLDDVWPRDTYLRVSRVYGQSLASVARVEVQSFVARVWDELGSADSLRSVRDGLEDLLPLADPILAGVHRRWIEHELAQVSVYAAELEGRIDGLTTHVAMLFVDIKDFTSYVDTAGDGAGIEAIDHFDRIVLEEQGEHGELVKALGDGFMLAYPTAVEAVESGHAMIRRMPPELGPALHASVHAGLALNRGGDYFGSTVNLAARLLGLAGTSELVSTRPVVDATASRFEWEPRVTTHIRGFRDPVAVFRLVGPR
jgi:adenylate cyclase